ncbi:helix-turn-helix domain-containing protein [Micromonospora sp. WMMD998]|uniref:PucR family transcriptional regulator n=1 Tax=Micromonospora sp. WMMD998 TaxID=3016092 RepID=UPI00249BF063|nr:helix-turn-helix domain-containing protein [Micromonospora sp. WMMD998]WFE41663.1 helix-turn-helix domain-containing protein [Micromonospora sp. WMMD998]
MDPLVRACQADAVSEPGGTETSATLRRIERAAGALATASVARMDESLPWFRELPADQRSWVMLVAQAGVRSLVQWLRQGGGATDRTQEVSDEVFDAAPQALARSISLQQTVALIKVTIEVVEEQVSELAVPGEEQSLREAVLRFSREIAFAAARVYARAAETRGSWDARLQALLVDALLRGDSPDVLASRAAALGWSDAPPVAVAVGRSPGGEVAAVLHTVYRQARRIGVEVIGGVHGDRLVVVLGGAADPLAAADKLRPAFGDGPVVVGPAVPSLDEATESARAALAGFRAAPAWPTAPCPVAAAELLPERALAGDTEARRRLRHDVYAALARAGGELLETLDAFFAAGGTLESAARALFVHPNTVRYRLKRIAEVTGFSPLAPRDAFALQLALTVGRLDPVAPAVTAVPNQTPGASGRKVTRSGDDHRRSL